MSEKISPIYYDKDKHQLIFDEFSEEEARNHLKQINFYLKLQELVKEMDIQSIIQFLKEYGFSLCSTTECRNKIAKQHDKLIKLQSLIEESEK